MHVGHDDHLLRAVEHALLVAQEVRNDARDLAAGGQHRAGDRTHQPVVAAAVDECEPGFAHRDAQRFRGCQHGGISAVTRPAIHTDGFEIAHPARLTRGSETRSSGEDAAHHARLRDARRTEARDEFRAGEPMRGRGTVMI